MKRIIAVSGHANCGKTTCLRYLIELLRNPNVDLTTIVLPNEELTNGKIKDVSATFVVGDHVICVCTEGDDAGAIEDNFKYAEENNADILVTATRVKGPTIKALEKKESELIQMTGEKEKCSIVTRFKKPDMYYMSKENQDFCNREFAKYLYEKVVASL